MENIVISILVFLIVIVLHELAHAYAAYKLGDTTARDSGRLTLNPIAHLDPVGTVVLPLMLIMAHSPVVFGWAKPVPIDPSKFKHPRQGMLITSLAGPFANLALAGIFAMVFKAGIFPNGSIGWNFLLTGVIISLVLGIFNLMPIPPLDGSGILFSIIPRRVAGRLIWLERYGFIILIGLLYLGLFDRVIIPSVSFLMHVLIG